MEWRERKTFRFLAWMHEVQADINKETMETAGFRGEDSRMG